MFRVILRILPTQGLINLLDDSVMGVLPIYLEKTNFNLEQQSMFLILVYIFWQSNR